MAQLKVHQAIAKALVDNGVDHMFGLIGDANLYMVDSFMRDFGGKFTSFANEDGAALAALGYSSMAGKIGCASVTHGAAVSNTATALAHGAKARTPMLLLCGDTAVVDRDNFQNFPQREHIVSTGAGFEQLRSPETIAEDVATALRRAFAESRPIALNIPVEFQWLDTEYESAPFRRPSTRTIVPESEDLDNAIGVIAAARRPLVLAGRGAITPEAKTALLSLAKRLDAPVATTLQAKDLFRGEPYNLGIFGTLTRDECLDFMLEADCIIAFGASLNEYTLAHGSFAEGKRIVQVDIAPSQLRRYTDVDVAVQGDAAATAELFENWLNEAEIPGSGWTGDDLLAQLGQTESAPSISPSSKVEMGGVVQLMNQILPDDRVVVTDGGRFLGQIWKHLEVPTPEDFLITLAFGSIGLGMGHAIGTAACRPDRKVVHVTGDGGWALGGLAEFHTAVRHGLNITTIVCNDSAYGAEYIQFRRKQMDPALSVFEWPDFAAVARAMGGLAFTVETYAELEEALKAVAASDTPSLIDIKLDPETMPEFP